MHRESAYLLGNWISFQRRCSGDQLACIIPNILCGSSDADCVERRHEDLHIFASSCIDGSGHPTASYTLFLESVYRGSLGFARRSDVNPGGSRPGDLQCTNFWSGGAKYFRASGFPAPRYARQLNRPGMGVLDCPGHQFALGDIADPSPRVWRARLVNNASRFRLQCQFYIRLDIANPRTQGDMHYGKGLGGAVVDDNSSFPFRTGPNTATYKHGSAQSSPSYATPAVKLKDPGGG